MEPLKTRINADFEWAHITKLELLHMKKTTQNFTVSNC